MLPTELDNREAAGQTNTPDVARYAWDLAAQDVQINLEPLDSGTLVSVTHADFSRHVTLGKEYDIKVITAAEGIRDVTGNPDSTEPLLAIVGAKNDIELIVLTQPVPAGISASEFLVPKEGTRVVTPDVIERVEATVRNQITEITGFQEVELPEEITFPNENRDINGKYLVAVNETDDSLVWFYPKATKLKKTPLRRVLADNGSNDDISFAHAKAAIDNAPSLHGRQTKNQMDTLANAMASDNPAVVEFLQEQLKTRQARQQSPDANRNTDYLARLKERILISVALRRMGNPPFDQIAQRHLDEARTEIQTITEEETSKYILSIFRTNPNYYRPMLTADLATQREVIAWDLATEKVKAALLAAVEPTATQEELNAAFVEDQNRLHVGNVLKERVRKTTYIVDDAGDRIPSWFFFARRGKSPFTIQQFSELPIRPVLLPKEKPEPGAEGLATFLFDSILHAPQVCDTRGALVRMGAAKRQDYIDRLTRTIKREEPIVASEYLPLIAVASPIKRNTQSPALAEIDLIRRRMEIMKAVEMFYDPGMNWMLGNEAPAFQGPMFNLPGDYVGDFQQQVDDIVRMIDPEGTHIHFFNMADLLWGNPQRQAEWMTYKEARYAEVVDAYNNPLHPEHTEVVTYINTFVYPMATCINPYKLEQARGLSMEEILQVYAQLKVLTGTGFRGVDASVDDYDANLSLSPQQTQLLEYLFTWGKEITFKYRTAMDAREVLPAFRELIPNDVIAHTIISKPDKLVLFPNSAKGAYFPAHGEPILMRGRAGERTTVTVHPWWMIAAQPDKYVPYFVEGREEPLYFMPAT